MRLKTGGHVMVVEAITGDGLRMCFWTHEGELRRDTFNVDELEKVGDQPTLPEPPKGV